MAVGGLTGIPKREKSRLTNRAVLVIFYHIKAREALTGFMGFLFVRLVEKMQEDFLTCFEAKPGEHDLVYTQENVQEMVQSLRKAFPDGFEIRLHWRDTFQFRPTETIMIVPMALMVKSGPLVLELQEGSTFFETRNPEDYPNVIPSRRDQKTPHDRH